MNGVPVDLDLTRFVGFEVSQLCIDQHQLQVVFMPEVGWAARYTTIAIEGHWELRDRTGSLVDGAEEHAARDTYRVHRLLGRRVVSFALAAPESFALTFDDGLELRVFDSNAQYESFSIQPGGIVV